MNTSCERDGEGTLHRLFWNKLGGNQCQPLQNSPEKAVFT